MPKLSKTAGDHTREDFIGEEMQVLTPTVVVASSGMVTCGVNRKVNIGNFENLDIYMALTMPIVGATFENLDELKEIVSQSAEVAFSNVTRETGERYLLIKKALREGRQEDPPKEATSD